MNKTVAGCAIGGCVAVVLIGITAVLLGPRIAKWGWSSTKQYAEKKIEEKEKEQREFNQILSNWFPPAPDIKGEDLFPTDILAYKRNTVDSNVEVTEINLSRQGQHALYVQGQDGIDVFAFPATEEEWNHIHDAASEAVKGLPNHSWMCAGTSCTLSRFSDDAEVSLLLNRGWIIIFRSKDLDSKKAFVSQFFNASSKRPA